MSRKHDVLTPVRPRKPSMAGTGAATDLLLPQALFYNTFSAQNAEALFFKAAKLFPTHRRASGQAPTPRCCLSSVIYCGSPLQNPPHRPRTLLSKEGSGKMSQRKRPPPIRATGKSDEKQKGAIAAPSWNCLGGKGACFSPSLQGGLQSLQEEAPWEAPRCGRSG